MTRTTVPANNARVIYIGIDPGVSGGIAMLGADGRVLGAWKMPELERELWNLLAHRASLVRYEEAEACAVIEFVHASPLMGVVSAFTFGKGYGRLRMALVGAGISFSEVSPVSWQNAMRCRTRGDKNISKRRAQDLFPRVTVTHALADALLLAEYCRRSALGIWNQPGEHRSESHGKEGKEAGGKKGQAGKGRSWQGRQEEGGQAGRRTDPSHAEESTAAGDGRRQDPAPHRRVRVHRGRP